MKDEFYMVLPSNSSMNYYPDNVTTRYTTHLPQRMSLHGSWAVSLAEIHIPTTILHVPTDSKRNFLNMTTEQAAGISMKYEPIEGKRSLLNIPTDQTAGISMKYVPVDSERNIQGMTTELAADISMKFAFKEDRSCVLPGVYHSIGSLLEVINEIPYVTGHLEFKYARNGYVTVTRVCEACKNMEHTFFFSDVLSKVLGFTETRGVVIPRGGYVAQRPANLANGTPNTMYVYTDICEPYITGDVHTPLLRVVPIAAADNYNYGSVRIRSFSPPRYVPLLRTSFQTITIDIRDEFGEPIPFEHGTLTVTLHFKRID